MDRAVLTWSVAASDLALVCSGLREDIRRLADLGYSLTVAARKIGVKK